MNVTTEDGDDLSSMISTLLHRLDDDNESTDLSSPPSTTTASSMSSIVSTWSITDEDSSGSGRRHHRGVILEGVKTTVTSSMCDLDVEMEWKSSGDAHHHDGSPLIVLRSASQRLIDPSLPGLELGDDEIHRKVMLNARKLPKALGGLAGLHVILNNERIKRQVAPLQRMPALDEIAQHLAARMADNQELKHCDPVEILRLLLEKGNTCVKRVGSNVSFCDGDVAGMHERMMRESLSDRNNILDRRYTTLGVATRKAPNGSLYVCELFLG
jgi:hypothetical protein